MIDVLLVCVFVHVYMQVQFLREKFSNLDIEVDGGLSPSTIDTAAQVCVKEEMGGGGDNLGCVQYLLYMTL